MTMKVLALNVQTTGFDPSQDAILEIGAALVNGTNGDLTNRISLLIDHGPEFVVPDPAFEAHGISGILCHAYGMPMEIALHAVAALADKADTMLAYNARFHLNFLMVAASYAQMELWPAGKPRICLMEAMSPVCAIPNKRGDGWKSPKMSEACAHTGIKYPESRAALADAVITYRLWNWIKNNSNPQ